MTHDASLSYEDALSYIESTLMFGLKPSLARISRLLSLLGNPEKSLKFIHIAGTNGKGSTANACASVLKEAGYKTGLFTSPYIIDFRERMIIDGVMISKTDLTREVEKIMPLVKKVTDEGLKPNEFEVITALAFDFFKNQGCDIVVLEVGLGGSFDATNIIEKPLVSVITSISLDHTKILGDTVSEIASEKCGIIKNGGVTVTAPNQKIDALEVIMKSCAERNNRLIIPNINSVKVLLDDFEGTAIEYGGLNIHIPLPGKHQILNFITAVEALKTLNTQGFNLSDAVIEKGLSKVSFPARLEILCREPLMIIDGAHNPGGIETLCSYIKSYLNEPPVIILGMLADKDYETSIAAVAALAKAVVTLKPENARALDEEKSAQIAGKCCKNVYALINYREALIKAIEIRDKAPIIVCGSLFLAAKMRTTVIDYIRETGKTKLCN